MSASSACPSALGMARHLCNPVAIAITFWFLHFYVIKDLKSVVDSDLVCSNGDDLASLKYTRFVRQLTHANSLSDQAQASLSPRVLHWEQHVLIAFIENIRMPTDRHAETIKTQSVIRILQNVTNIQSQRIRDIVRNGRSAQWKTLRIVSVKDGNIQGPVQLAQTPDGKGVVIMSSYTKVDSEGLIVSVSHDKDLSTWTTQEHKKASSLDKLALMDLVKPSATVKLTVQVSVVTEHIHTPSQTMLVQTYGSHHALLQAKHHECPTCTEHCGTGNYTFARVLLPTDYTAKQATSTTTETPGLLHVFVLDTAGRLARVDVPGYSTLSACRNTTLSETKFVPLYMDTARSNVFGSFRLIPFNSNFFYTKKPNFSIFSAVLRYTRFNTLHTHDVEANRIVAIKMNAYNGVAACSPVLMHFGAIKGIHSTQLNEDYILTVYTRLYRNISTIHVAGLDIGNAHTAH